MSKKAQLKEPPQSAKDAGYQNHSFVRHGLAQLQTLNAMVAAFESDMVSMGECDHRELAHLWVTSANVEAAFHSMNVAHAEVSKMMQEKGFRKIDALTDWVDADGNALGIGGR